MANKPGEICRFKSQILYSIHPSIERESFLHELYIKSTVTTPRSEHSEHIGSMENRRLERASDAT